MSNSDTPACPCGAPTYPDLVFNPPGLSRVAYRFGDYAAVREALLRALPGEAALADWRPAPDGDLALQLVEWWAYLADVLSFYNERIASQAWLRTADLPASVNRLIQLLGYRPRPATGATGVVAALASGTKGATLPKGLQIQSKPGPGQQPQVFELAADTTISGQDQVPSQPQAAGQPFQPASGGFFWLKGRVSGIKQDDRLLLIANAAHGPGTISDFAWLQVQSVSAAIDPFGNAVTQVSYDPLAWQIADGAQASDHQVLRPAQATPPWGYRPAGWKTPVFTPNRGNTGVIGVDLAAIARDIGAGSLVLLEVSSPQADPAVVTTVVSVKAYSEIVWYANGDGLNPPDPGSPPSIPAVPIAHTHLDFDQVLGGKWEAASGSVEIRHDWRPVGQLTPVLSQQANTLTTASPLTVTAGTLPAPGTAAPVLLEDANGNGVEATATVADAVTLTLSDTGSLPAQGLTAPISVLFNLLQISRGKTVANEVLGSGNAAVAGQDFTLQNRPVTYLQDPASRSGDKYSSTVQVWVNAVQWTEVQSFYGQAANAQIFVTREDEQGNTHVVFGDGINGARLPAGIDNVIASYRYGAGAAVPAASSLTALLQPQPGLRAIRNPIPPVGGADADPPDRVRTLAPRSVLTFDRAISLDDYAAIAANAPGVQRVKAAYVFDPTAQRPTVALWVGDDDGAVAAARSAITAAADPNRPVSVKPATPAVVSLSLTYLRDRRFQDSAVNAALHAALLDPGRGLFGVNVVQIGQAFYESQISAACLAVPGVQAVQDLRFLTGPRFAPLAIRAAVRMFRGGGSAIRPSFTTCTGHRYDPGPDSFFIMPDDGQHLTLIPGVVA